MKKTIKTMAAVAVALAMGMTANAKTWTNIVGAGLTAPTATDVDVKDGEKETITFNNVCMDDQYGVAEMYMGYHENGFAVLANVTTFATNMTNEVNGFDYTSFGCDLLVGAGFAPVRSDKFTLGLFGVAGLNYACGQSEKKDAPGATGTVQYTHCYLAGQLGGNVTAVYTPKQRFSVFASMTATYLLPGVYVWQSDFSSKTIRDDDYVMGTKGTYRVIPAVGVCWKF